MIGIVIVAHGGLAHEYLAALQHVVGAAPGIVSVGIEFDHDRETKKAEIRAAADAVDQGQGVIIVTDMFGGSPSNLSMPACYKDDRKIVYGANLPLLVKLAKNRHMPLHLAIKIALEAGRKYIDTCDGGG